MAGGSVETRVRAMPATQEGTLHRPQVTIRDFEPGDYPALVEIGNLVYPDNPTTVEEERFEDARFDRGKVFHRRLVAVDPATKTVVGAVNYGHMPWSFHPDRYAVWVGVHPAWQRHGVGGALAGRLLAGRRGREARAPPSRGGGPTPGAGPGAPRGGFSRGRGGAGYWGVAARGGGGSRPAGLYGGFAGGGGESRGRGIGMCRRRGAMDSPRRHGFRWIRTGNSTL